MKSAISSCRLIVTGLALASLFTFTAPCQAVEQAQEFVEGLRQRQLHDMAILYLEQIRNSDLCPPEMKEVIDYEKGITLMTGSRLAGTTSGREEMLAEARDAFQKFVKEHPDHPLAAGANTQIANVLVERGRINTEQADRPTKSPEEKKKLREEARALYSEAAKAFEAAEKRFHEELKEFPKFIEPKEVKKIEKRDQLRRDLVQARLFLATVTYEIALTYEKGAKERTEKLKDSAEKYADLAEKYGSRLAGMYARMWEGRCFKDLGESKKALEAFGELLMQPDEPAAFRTLKNKTLILALETYMLPSVKNYKAAMDRVAKWEESARGSEISSEDGLAIRFLGGQAALQYAKSLKPDEEGRKEALIEAKKAFEFVTRFPSDYQKEARQKLLDPLLSSGDVKEAEPKTFAEARDRGKTALDSMQAAEVQMKIELSEGKKDNIARLQKQMKESREEALKYYRMALGMVTPETPRDEINVIRYYLAYLYWTSEDIYKAAVVGEFLARKYPNSTGARQGAKIAMAAYVKMFNNVKPNEDRSFATQQMVDIASYITERWPDEPEANEAWMMLIRTAISDRDTERAAKYLENIADDSPQRGEAELMTGQALWAAYLRATRLPDEERPDQEELDKLVEQAKTTLETGIKRMRKPVDEGGEVSSTLVTAVLSLAQIYIDSGQPEEAVKWLDDPKVGAMTLVKAKAPVTDRGNFGVETYKAGLRAYVAVQELDKAEEAMNQLEELVSAGGDAEAGKTLTRIYISLGRELQGLLERLRKEGKVDRLERVSQGFELFLTRISQRDQGNTFNSLNWVAETFFGMGAGFDAGGDTLTPESKKYYTKAVETYRKILDRCKTDKSFAPQKGATDGIRIRLANAYRRLGEYKKAMALLIGVLEKSKMLVDAQVEAAYTYQAWADEKCSYNVYAIRGGRKTKAADGSSFYLIWGWGKIAKMLARSPKPEHKEIFHEARYNLALCRLRYALCQTDRATKNSLLSKAATDITIVQRLYPDMGGDEWFDKYNTLLKKVQKLQGVKAVGLEKEETVTAKKEEEADQEPEKQADAA